MCGINGQFAYDSDAPTVDPDEVVRIRDHMAPRGPDAAGAWFSEDGRVGFGHRRLAIIDLSPSGAQPMHSPDGRYSVVFNGEIYNYRALRRELEADGVRFASQSDTEVLLHLYARDGAAMAGRLRGMFAFAIYDHARAGVFLARDGFGIKPLYLADDGRTLRFASQVKALLVSPAVDRRAEPAGHVGFFLWGHVPDPFTLFRGVRALPSGSWLWVGRNERAEGTFAGPRELYALPPQSPAPAAPEEMRAMLREALKDTIAHHLVADVPVGLFLSAGLDSTSLLALAAEEAGERLQTITLGFTPFRGTAHDEVAAAAAIAERYGVRHTARWVDATDFRGELSRLLTAMDQPSIDGINTYFVSKAAHEAGLKVALTGLGGDELFGTYPSFRELPRAVGMLRPFAALPGLGRSLRRISAPVLRRLTSPKYAGLFEYGGRWEGAYLLRRGLYMPWELPEVLDPDLVREGWAALQPLASLAADHAPVTGARLKVSLLETSWYMRHQLLRDADWAGMAHGLELRVPLVDNELLRRIVPLLEGPFPPTKREMGASALRPLPATILERPKTGFVVPTREWLLEGSHVPPARGLRDWARLVHAQALAL